MGDTRKSLSSGGLGMEPPRGWALIQLYNVRHRRESAECDAEETCRRRAVPAIPGALRPATRQRRDPRSAAVPQDRLAPAAVCPPGFDFAFAFCQRGGSYIRCLAAPVGRPPSVIADSQASRSARPSFMRRCAPRSRARPRDGDCVAWLLAALLPRGLSFGHACSAYRLDARHARRASGRRTAL